MASFNYVPSPSGMRLHECQKFLKMLVGPYGSGKSCSCAVDVLTNACAQNAAPDGVRYSRVGVIRATYPELFRATRKSLLEVMPPECGWIAESGAPIKGFYRIPLPDGTSVSLELELWAIGSAADCEKLRSCNWTFCWINEATGCVPEVYATVLSRIGRFPSQDLGGIAWGGTIMDFNMPELGSWLDVYIKNPAPNWEVVMQPPAAFKREGEDGRPFYEINPEAENLRNLGAPQEGDPPDMTPMQRGLRYYRDQIDNYLKLGRYDKVDNLFCMMDVPIVDGKPIYPGFSVSQHVSPHEIDPVAGQEVVIGMDQSGLHPAAVFVQWQRQRWCVLDEIYAEGEGFENFLHGMLIPLIKERYARCPVVCAIDPSNERDSAMGITPKERLEEAGLRVAPFCTNNPKTRIYAVEMLLNRIVGGLLVDPLCDMLIRGFTHEYRYRKLKAGGTGGDAYAPRPEKNDASHVHDALQYAVLYINGRDEGRDEAARKAAAALSERRKALARIV